METKGEVKDGKEMESGMCLENDAKYLKATPYALKGRYLHENRLRWGWSLREAADHVCAGVVLFGEWERGIKEPPNDVLGVFSDPKDKTMPNDAELGRRFNL